MFSGCELMLSNNVTVSSSNPSYNHFGQFGCSGNGILYDINGTIVKNNITTCTEHAIWTNEDKVLCGYGEKIVFHKNY